MSLGWKLPLFTEYKATSYLPVGRNRRRTRGNVRAVPKTHEDLYPFFQCGSLGTLNLGGNQLFSMEEVEEGEMNGCEK